MATTTEHSVTKVSGPLLTFVVHKISNMKIIVTGSLGHISQPLTQQLVQKGHSVTVISSNPEKQKDIEALGATAAIGTMQDIGFLTAAFTGADAVYTMVPPYNFFDPNVDNMTYWTGIARNYAEAIRQSGVKKVVHLSSIGAHMDKNSGLLLAHHEVEGILSQLTDIAIAFMRPVGFYYNLYSFVQVIKHTGAIASNYGDEDLIPWVSPADIASAVAEELETQFTGIKIRYVASEELTCNQAAAILGEAIGKPDLKWIRISDEQLQSSLEGIGMPKPVVSGFVEMNAAMHTGELFEDYYRHQPTLGQVKLTDFAKDFAAAYQQS